MRSQFRDRTEAGRHLASQLKDYQNHPHTWVIGLPRGGAVVAHAVARALHLPLDICLVRKLGVPGHPELALGAIASGGIRILNDNILRWRDISEKNLERVTAKELRELRRRDRVYRGDRPRPVIRDQTLIVVDDGIATGATMRAAIAVLKAQRPQKIIVATPVAPPETCQALSAEADQVICLATPNPFYALGFWYEDFAQVTDDEVRQLLEQQAHNTRMSPVLHSTVR